MASVCVLFFCPSASHFSRLIMGVSDPNGLSNVENQRLQSKLRRCEKLITQLNNAKNKKKKQQQQQELKKKLIKAKGTINSNFLLGPAQFTQKSIIPLHKHRQLGTISFRFVNSIRRSQFFSLWLAWSFTEMMHVGNSSFLRGIRGTVEVLNNYVNDIGIAIE